MKISKTKSGKASEELVREFSDLESHLANMFLTSIHGIMEEGEVMHDDSFSFTIPKQGVLFGKKKLFLNVSLSTKSRIITIGLSAVRDMYPTNSDKKNEPQPRQYEIKASTYLLGEKNHEYRITPDEPISNVDLSVNFPRLNYIMSQTLATISEKTDDVIVHDFEVILPNLMNIIRGQMALANSIESIRDLTAASLENL